MEIVDLRIMRGPNYWSVKHPKIIVAKLNLNTFNNTLTSDIDGFFNRLKKMFPGMYQHRGVDGVKGGFFEAVRQGARLSYVVEHIALELQTLGGMNCGFGRTFPSPQKAIDYVIFSYSEERAGEYAAFAALRICEALTRNGKYNLKKDIDKLHQIREDEHIGPSTFAIVNEAVSRGIPYIRLNRNSLIQLGYGVNQKRIQATMTCKTPFFAVELADDKNATKEMLHEAGIPVPRGTTVFTLTELRDAIEELGYPVVTKPLDGNHGKGASINIKSWKEAHKGFAEAQKFSGGIIIEQFIEGSDYRLLVINKKFVAASKRTPAMVTGDGKSTIEQLINQVNKDPRRGIGHEKELTQIKVDKFTRAILKAQELTLKSVLKNNEVLFLKSTANISTGGTATDVTDIIDPYNILMAERIAGIIGLDICGIDVMATDIAIPLKEARGAVLEVNAAPGFRMHVAPTEGLPRNVAEPVIDMLFPHSCPARIPIIAVTGTNGKTTTTRLIAHIIKQAGYQVGFTTTDGIYIQDKMLEKGDTTGAKSTAFVLKDPTVNFAVLECARGGILRSGLGFDQCDIGIVTNVAADHLGLRDINTIEEMAKVKAVIPKSVRQDGYAILNADDELVFPMARQVESQVAFFSLNENNPHILKHIAKGGLAAVLENGYISIFKNSYKVRVDRAADIPLTFNGRARFNIENVLASTLAAYVSRVPVEDIKTALRTFIPSPTKTPGRMNLFKFPNFDVLVDYAHNAAGLKAIGEFIQTADASCKVGIIAGLGDRRDEDTRQLGALAASMFDEIIIRQDKDLRGSSPAHINNMLLQGIHTVKKDKPVIIIPEEMRAIAHALENANRGGLVIIFSEDINEAIKLVENFKTIQDRRVLVD